MTVMDSTCSVHGTIQNSYRVLVGKAEGGTPLGKPRCTWEDDIKMDLREVSCDAGDWINLAQDRDKLQIYV